MSCEGLPRRCPRAIGDPRDIVSAPRARYFGALVVGDRRLPLLLDEEQRDGVL